MKKFFIINGTTIYLKMFSEYAEAKKWAGQKCDLSKGVLVQEYLDLVEFQKFTVILN